MFLSLFFIDIVHLFTRRWIHADHLWEPCTAYGTAIALDFGISSIAIGYQYIQLFGTNFLWHGSYKVVVM